MPPLHRALALAKVHDVARTVAKDLYFDMPRPGNVLFEKDGRLFEQRLAFDAGRFEIVAQLCFICLSVTTLLLGTQELMYLGRPPCPYRHHRQMP
jgi:hypothetical protein